MTPTFTTVADPFGSWLSDVERGDPVARGEAGPDRINASLSANGPDWWSG